MRPIQIQQNLKAFLVYASIIFGTSIIYIGLIYYAPRVAINQRLGVVTTSGTFPTALNNFQDNDIINAGDWNNIEYSIGEIGTTSAATLRYLVTNTNSNNISYTGRLTITNASTTNFSTPASGSFNLNATGTMQGFAFCTSGNAACGTALTIGGSDTQIQFNDSSVLGGDSAFTWDKNANKLTVTNSTTTYGTITTLTASSGTIDNATTTNPLFLARGTFSLTANGEIFINTNLGGTLQFREGFATQVLSATSSFSFTVASTTASENITLKRFDQAVTIQKVSCVNQGGSSPSVTYNLPHGTDRTSGTNLLSANEAVTNTTTGTQIYAFNDASLAAGEVIWLITSASSGANGWFGCTVYYKLDP